MGTTKKEQKNTNTSKAQARGIELALIAYAILVVLQFIAYILTGILALYAQALEVLSDVMVSSFFLMSFLWSQRPPDEFHMFGHGRVQNVAAVVSAAILVFFMSIEAFRKAIPKLIEPISAGIVQNENIALIIVILSMAIIAVPSIYILRVKEKGASVKAQLLALLKDEVTFVATLIAIVLIGYGYYIVDAIVSLLVASVIALTGLYLLKDNIHYLIGRAPSEDFFKELEKAIFSVEGVYSFHDLKAEYVGPHTVQASLHLEVERGTPIEVADRIAHEVEKAVGKIAHCEYCVIHVDPKSVEDNLTTP